MSHFTRMVNEAAQQRSRIEREAFHSGIALGLLVGIVVGIAFTSAVIVGLVHWRFL